MKSATFRSVYGRNFASDIPLAAAINLYDSCNCVCVRVRFDNVTAISTSCANDSCPVNAVCVSLNVVCVTVSKDCC
jgi:hypothetical protein